MMPKILVVEDMEAIRQAITAALAKAGYNVLQAKDGAEGLEIAFLEHPELILVDIIMPEVDGIEMVKRLRDDDWGKTASVMMLTNVEDSDKIVAVQKYHVYDYLVKSNWELDDVVEHIKNKLKAATEENS
ncbi:response regulator [candidate division WWE3 bacterium]|uniref:Response regulator n=1 Tax=candidate division WWE3 bacterium TaxID=2053526 RepID=A0A955LGP7_UNCKA|nr:response regulator [candidate division WWE3 bacterium]